MALLLTICLQQKERKKQKNNKSEKKKNNNPLSFHQWEIIRLGVLFQGFTWKSFCIIFPIDASLVGIN